MPSIISIIHKINYILHQEPFNFLSEGIFWSVVLGLLCPFIAIFKFLQTFYNFCLYAVGFYNPSIESPRNDSKRELAVVVTGCDTGFGQELAFQLAAEGFVVFSGCLQKSSFKQFEGGSNIIPLKMDVTNEQDIAKAYEAVSEWTKGYSDERHRKRCLHGIVNNAGMRTVLGLIDWVDVSYFEKVMDVNYLGAVRTVKAFLPIIKRQAADQVYSDARIINMVSCAGMSAPVPLGAAYGATKFALESFTTSLAHELKIFGVKVTAFNPSFHDTPLSFTMKDIIASFWDKMPETKRQEYGEDFIKPIIEQKTPPPWPRQVVLDEIAKCLLSQYPSVKVMVGTDAKFAHHILAKIPTWGSIQVASMAMRYREPAMLKKGVSLSAAKLK